METKFIEVTNKNQNWGKFLLGRFTQEEWERQSAIDERSLLRTRGWTEGHLIVVDLETGEGALFRLGGCAKADLNDKHQIWVCPMYQPFLEWLYQQKFDKLEELPSLVQLPDAEFSVYGYRRKRKT